MRFRNKVDLRHRLISLISEHQSVNNFERSADNSLPAAQMLWSRNSMFLVKLDHIPSWSNLSVYCQNDLANNKLVCNGFHSCNFYQVSKRIRRWHLFPWYADSTFLAFRLSAGVVIGTWVVPLQNKKMFGNFNLFSLHRTPSSKLSPLNHVVCFNLLIVRCSSFERRVTSQTVPWDSISHHLLNWFVLVSSAIDVAVVARVAACCTDRGPLKDQRALISLRTASFFSSEFLNSERLLMMSQHSGPTIITWTSFRFSVWFNKYLKGG